MSKLSYADLKKIFSTPKLPPRARTEGPKVIAPPLEKGGEPLVERPLKCAACGSSERGTLLKVRKGVYRHKTCRVIEGVKK